MSRPSVILLHGWGGSFNATFGQYGWVGDLLGHNRRVMTFDLPGHGGAPASHDPAAYSDLAGSVLETLGDADPVYDVIGYSLGAKLALEMACRRPGLFGRMALGGVGDNVFAPERAGAAVAAALEGGLPPDAPAPVRGLVEYAALSGGDPRAMAAVLRRPPNPVADPGRLSTIQSAILVVNGEDDALARPDTALLAALPTAIHQVLPGVDHFALPGSAGFRQAALAFLDPSARDHVAAAASGAR